MRYRSPGSGKLQIAHIYHINHEPIFWMGITRSILTHGYTVGLASLCNKSMLNIIQPALRLKIRSSTVSRVLNDLFLNSPKRQASVFTRLRRHGKQILFLNWD